MAASLAPSDLPDSLLSSGTTSFTVADAARLTGQSEALARQSLKRLIDTGRVASPARGLYVPVSPEFRSWGAPPALHFLEAMMRHLDRRYYVALLSAAELHGVAHQRPQVFQVMVDRQLPSRRVGRSEMRFYTSGKIANVPTQAKPTPTGQVLVSTVEATALDLAFRPVESGGLDNVATVIGELVEEQAIDFAALARAAQVYPATAVRRVGWILEKVCGVDVSDRLAPRDAEPTMLDPHGTRRGPIDPTWNVIVNADVVPDL